MVRLKHATVILVLTLSVYIGYDNTDDITNTITIWQRLVGVTATVYATLGLVALVGYWLRASWLRRVLWVWAFLVILASGLAAMVYGATGGFEPAGRSGECGIACSGAVGRARTERSEPRSAGVAQ